MKMPIAQVLLLAAAGVVLSGCVRSNIERSFANVQGAVADRTGKQIEWLDVSSEGQAVGQAIEELLKDGLTVDEAVQTALLNNRRLQATYSDLGVAVAELVEAGLLENPVFTGAYRLRDDQYVFEGSVAQDFLSLLLLPLRRQRARAELAQAQIRVTGEVINLAGETRRAFYRYQADQQRVELLRSVVLSTGAAYEMAWRLRAAGNVTQLNLMNERAPFEQAKLDLARAELMLLKHRERLNRLMGLWGHGTLWTVDHRLAEVPDAESEPENAEALAVANSLDLAEARLDLEVVARRAGIRNVRELLPELELGVDSERESETEYKLKKRKIDDKTEYKLDKESEHVWWVGPALTVPVPIFNQGQPARAVAWAQVRRQWEEYNALAVEVRSHVRVALQQLRYERQRAQYYRELMVPLRHRITDQTQLRYNAMFLGIFQLLEAREREINAGERYVEALRDYWVARAELDQILQGRLPDESRREQDGQAMDEGGREEGNGDH
ncbi:MAG: TolC family protein [FCB group bacterium]|jgi:cobalt-zinc-cadmium efflux system outer membrane protein|nr:TolC family protein [FCB group bacterium]